MIINSFKSNLLRTIYSNTSNDLLNHFAKINLINNHNHNQNEIKTNSQINNSNLDDKENYINELAQCIIECLIFDDNEEINDFYKDNPNLVVKLKIKNKYLIETKLR